MAEKVRLVNTADTFANWSLNDPILAVGEFGVDITNKQIRFGDNTNTWLNLPIILGDDYGPLESIGDVDLTNPTVSDGTILIYLNSKWIPGPIIGDVDISSKTSTYSVRYLDDIDYNPLILQGGESLTWSAINQLWEAEYQKLFRVEDLTPPSTSTASGILGEIRYDNNYLYMCISANNWKRLSLNTW